MTGDDIYRLAQYLWPLNRSITGDGVRETLGIIKLELPNLVVHEVPSGTQAFDWTIPKEWRVRSAYITAPNGQRICDFSKNNLHLVGYSVPVRRTLSLSELRGHLHTLPNQPNAIPYITSYYKEHWGFCLAYEDYEKLTDGQYEVVIDSLLFDGSLTYAELLIPGELREEVLLSTYVCHPSMANNELSGPCVTTFIAKWLLEKKRKYSYRIVFVPEIIGSIAYISKNINHLKSVTIAGLNISCVGDDRMYSYLPSRNGDTLSDRAIMHVLKFLLRDRETRVYTWRDRGSDEQQYCAPGIDLPVASVFRTKYGMYPEYHTSLDDLVNVVTPIGLEGGFAYVLKVLEVIERECYPLVTVNCEPFLSKRGLYRTLSTLSDGPVLVRDILTWCDGKHSLIEIAELCERPIWDLCPILDQLIQNGLVTTAQARL